MKAYYSTDLGSLYLGDFLEIAPRLTEQAALICIDPPYNIGKDTWDKIPDYQAWMGKVFLECQRLLADNGSFYWFHNKMPVIARLMTWIEENTDFIFKQFIIWNKRYTRSKNKGFFDGYVKEDQLRNYQKIAEYCLFYTFQDETGLSKIMGDCVYPIREYLRSEILRAKGKIVFKEINQVLGTADNGGGVASACLSENKTVPAVITKEHYLKLREWLNGDYLRKEYEDLRKEYEDLRKEYEDLRYTFNNQKTDHSVWEFEISSKIGHLTPKPVPLIENILKHSSNPGDLCVDFFGGSGTLGVACENLGRRWIMCEKSEKYAEIAAKRIEETANQMKF
jgi:site-specific DNA-methyltransferase (adenine-specific)